ncbi:MAG: hypothetical protein IIX72_00445 [Oscillospiraceae bacterium]|jgi:hypothetical protein|nr:hypothetical protein [Oscillospiraceae bacterium]
MSNTNKSNFYLGMGMGLVVGSCAGLAMRGKKHPAKNALGRTLKNVGEVVDSISGAMGW